jgi:hypothetical protein
MSKDSWGASATIATRNRGLYGVRATVTLPTQFGASGVDSRNYFDAYFGVFADSAETAFIEAGIAYYGELHRNKNGTQTAAPFAGHWSTLLNPVGGALRDAPAQGQRNALYSGGASVGFELTVDKPNLARFLVDGASFRSSPDFTFGFGGKGVEQKTFDQGLNIKACIGFNDADHTVHFQGMRVQIDQLYAKDAKGKLAWAPATGFSLVAGLTGALVNASANTLTVSYPVHKKKP